MNGSPSVRVALFIRESGSESPCRWFYVTGIYSGFLSPDSMDTEAGLFNQKQQENHKALPDTIEVNSHDKSKYTRQTD